MVNQYDFAGVSNRQESVSATSTKIASDVGMFMRRKQIIVTNLSAITVTIAKGDVAAVANTGIILSQNQSWFEADDASFNCWQGQIQAIGSGAGTLSVVEVFESVTE